MIYLSTFFLCIYIYLIQHKGCKYLFNRIYCILEKLTDFSRKCTFKHIILYKAHSNVYKQVVRCYSVIIAGKKLYLNTSGQVFSCFAGGKARSLFFRLNSLVHQVRGGYYMIEINF